MSQIAVSFRNFPDVANADENIRFTKVDLAHAAIGAGRNWGRRAKGASAIDGRVRVDTMRTIINYTRGRNISASRFYRTRGSTEKAMKSFHLGNTMCALIAHKRLRIPWLVDVERLNRRYQVNWAPGERRADFIGRSPQGLWYAFEAKGRSWMPSRRQLNGWKEQARMVAGVNGRQVMNNIVSATFVDEGHLIRAIWEDPPSEDGMKIEISDEEFFEIYYEAVDNLMASEVETFEIEGHRMTYLEDCDVSLGIHQLVQGARESGDLTMIFALAERFSDLPEASSFDSPLTIYPDGLVLKLGNSWLGESDKEM